MRSHATVSKYTYVSILYIFMWVKASMSCPGQRNRRRPVPVPLTGVRYTSLLWMCTLNILTWPKRPREWGLRRARVKECFRLTVGITTGLLPNLNIKYFFLYFSFQPVLHDWCNKGCGMCCPVCGMVHIKEPLLLIGKSSPGGGSGFPLSLSKWSFTICPTPYNRK